MRMRSLSASVSGIPSIAIEPFTSFTILSISLIRFLLSFSTPILYHVSTYNSINNIISSCKSAKETDRKGHPAEIGCPEVDFFGLHSLINQGDSKPSFLVFYARCNSVVVRNVAIVQVVKHLYAFAFCVCKNEINGLISRVGITPVLPRCAGYIFRCIIKHGR